MMMSSSLPSRSKKVLYSLVLLTLAEGSSKVEGERPRIRVHIHSSSSAQ